MDHSKCQHPATKSGRASCRRKEAQRVSDLISRAFVPPDNYCDRCGASEQEPCVKRDGSIAPQTHAARKLDVERPESVSEKPPALSRVLTRATARPSLWVAVRDATGVIKEGYIISTDGEKVMIHCTTPVDEIMSLSWGNNPQIFDESP